VATPPEREAVAAVAHEQGLETQDPSRLVRDALAAIVVGEGREDALQVADAANIIWISPYIWAKRKVTEDMSMNAAAARRIITRAIELEMAEGEVPSDDAKAIAKAIEIGEQAQEANDAGMQAQEIDEILSMVYSASNGNGSEPTPEPEPEEEPVAAEPEPETKAPERQSSTPRNLPRDEVPEDKLNYVDVEPWEAYSDDNAGAVVETLNFYEKAPDVTHEEYRDILEHVWWFEHYRQDRRTRQSVIAHIETAVKHYDKEHGSAKEEPAGAPSPEGRPEDAAAPEADAGGAGAEAEEPSAGEEDGDRVGVGLADADEDAPGDPDGPSEVPWPDAEGDSTSNAVVHEVREDLVSKDGAEDYADAIDAVLERLRAERLHVPAAIEVEPPELPFDLTQIADVELQRLHSAFTSYEYRSNFLLLVEEGIEQLCRQAADEIVEAIIAENDDHKMAVTVLEARAEQDDNVKLWRHRQRKHAHYAQAMRKERNGYEKLLERLSRLEAMRQGEFERAGGKAGKGRR
jgi:hypothetical protein